MLRRLGVRGKILATLAVPIFVLVLMASWITWQSLQENRRAEQVAAIMSSLELQDAAGTAVANERAQNIAAANGLPGGRKALVDAQELTDKALDARDKALEALDTSALPSNIQDAIQRTLDDRGVLDEVQRKSLAGQIEEPRATSEYTDLIENALDVPRAIAQTSSDSGLARRVEAYNSLDAVMLANTLERPVAAVALAGTLSEQGASVDIINRMVTSLQSTDALFEDADDALDAVSEDLSVPAYDPDFRQLRTQLEFVTLSGMQEETVAQWPTLSQDWVDATQPVRNDVRSTAVDYADSQADQARITAILTGVGVFGVVLLSFLIAVGISRRIVTPLRRLTTATADVRDRLPQMVEQMAVPGQAPSLDLVQVPVESSDEVGRLAAAFNEVNETTMVVAREQAALRGSIAEMFVNVARRDQVLLNRQLAFLDDLERSEEDAGTLSNLFRLDHLATRMRRNAESLLVLAGIDSGRRVRNPMPISDVIRTASSEIEFYDRVSLALIVDPHMLGHNALSAAHLLAELVENATSFSEPHTPVEVRTSRDERGVVVTIRDHGLGMTAEEITDANYKVTSTAASEAVGAQRLGLFVVGRLAERLGAVVTFAAGGSEAGTTVTVVFPAVLFLPDDALPLPQPTDPLDTSTQAAVAANLAPASPQPEAVEPVAPAPVTEVPDTVTSPTSSIVPAPAAFETASFAAVAEPEPPTAVAVDLDALTDGTTSVGMPRRRVASAAEARTDTGPIVLPPLEAPSLPELPDAASEGWRPPSQTATSGSALPSRHRAVASEPVPVVPEPAPESAPVLGVQQRTGLFSSFRSMESLDAADAESTLQLDAITEDPAAVPSALAPAAAPAPDPVVPVPVVEPLPAPVERREPVPAPAIDQTQVFAPVAPPVPEPAVPVAAAQRSEAPTTAGAALPVRGAAAPSAPSAGAPVVREVPQSAVSEPELTRPSAHGLDPVPPSGLVPQAPVASPAIEDRGVERLPAFEDLMSDLPTRRAVREGTNGARKRGLFGRKPSEGDDASAFGAVPAAASPSWPAAPEPAASRVAQEPAAELAAPESTMTSSYGGSVLPLRSTERAGGDALDPHFVPDTVEARSEWMASAVLYEEMSALLQRGVFQEGNVTPTNDEQTYRPTTVAADAGSGLVRRKRQGDDSSAGERFTARIERDPEQLRSRLSAFQSATSRGRSDARAGTPSTALPLSVNDVPGTTPHQR